MQHIGRFSPEAAQAITELREALRIRRGWSHTPYRRTRRRRARLALEITSDDDLRPATLYVRDGASLLKSSLINELLEDDDDRFVFLVIDECPPKDRAEIWNQLKRKRFGSESSQSTMTDDAVDSDMRVFDVPPVGLEEIVSILIDHEMSKMDAQRMAAFCEGCPRVAHVLGETYTKSDKSIAVASDGGIWDRFIVGKDDPNSEAVQLRRRNFWYLALFELSASIASPG